MADSLGQFRERQHQAEHRGPSTLRNQIHSSSSAMDCLADNPDDVQFVPETQVQVTAHRGASLDPGWLLTRPVSSEGPAAQGFSFGPRPKPTTFGRPSLNSSNSAGQSEPIPTLPSSQVSSVPIQPQSANGQSCHEHSGFPVDEQIFTNEGCHRVHSNSHSRTTPPKDTPPSAQRIHREVVEGDFTVSEAQEVDAALQLDVTRQFVEADHTIFQNVDSNNALPRNPRLNTNPTRIKSQDPRRKKAETLKVDTKAGRKKRSTKISLRAHAPATPHQSHEPANIKNTQNPAVLHKGTTEDASAYSKPEDEALPSEPQPVPGNHPEMGNLPMKDANIAIEAAPEPLEKDVVKFVPLQDVAPDEEHETEKAFANSPAEIQVFGDNTLNIHARDHNVTPQSTVLDSQPTSHNQVTDQDPRVFERGQDLTPTEQLGLQNSASTTQIVRAEPNEGTRTRPESVKSRSKTTKRSKHGQQKLNNQVQPHAEAMLHKVSERHDKPRVRKSGASGTGLATTRPPKAFAQSQTKGGLSAEQLLHLFVAQSQKEKEEQLEGIMQQRDRAVKESKALNEDQQSAMKSLALTLQTQVESVTKATYEKADLKAKLEVTEAQMASYRDAVSKKAEDMKKFANGLANDLKHEKAKFEHLREQYKKRDHDKNEAISTMKQEHNTRCDQVIELLDSYRQKFRNTQSLARDSLERELALQQQISSLFRTIESLSGKMQLSDEKIVELEKERDLAMGASKASKEALERIHNDIVSRLPETTQTTVTDALMGCVSNKVAKCLQLVESLGDRKHVSVDDLEPFRDAIENLNSELLEDKAEFAGIPVKIQEHMTIVENSLSDKLKDLAGKVLKMQEVQADLARQREENITIQEKLSHEQNRASEFHRQLEDAKNETKSARERVVELTSELEMVREEQTRSSSPEDSERARELDSEFASLRSQVEHIQQELNACEAKLQESVASEEGLRRHIEELEGQVKDAENRFAEASESLRRSDDEQKARVEEMKEQTLNGARRLYHNDKAEWENKLHQSKQKAKRAEEQEKKARRDVELFGSELAKTKAELATKDAELETLRVDLSSKSLLIEELQAAESAQRAKVLDLEQSLDTAEGFERSAETLAGQQQQLSKTLREKEACLAEVQKANETAAAKSSELRRQLKELEKEAENRQHNLEKVQTESKRKFNQQREKHDHEILQMRNSLTSTKQNSEMEIATSQKAQKATEIAMADLQKRCTEELEALRQTLADNEALQKDLSQNIEEMRKEHKSVLCKQREKSKLDIDHLENQLKQAEIAKQTAESAQAQLQTDFEAQIKQRDTDFHLKCVSLEDRAVKAEGLVVEVTAKVKKSQEALQDMERDLAQAQVDANVRVQQLETDHGTKLSALQDRVNRAEASVSNLTNQVIKAETATREAEAINAQTVHEFESQIRQLRADHESKRKELEERATNAETRPNNIGRQFLPNSAETSQGVRSQVEPSRRSEAETASTIDSQDLYKKPPPRYIPADLTREDSQSQPKKARRKVDRSGLGESQQSPNTDGGRHGSVSHREDRNVIFDQTRERGQEVRDESNEDYLSNDLGTFESLNDEGVSMRTPHRMHKGSLYDVSSPLSAPKDLSSPGVEHADISKTAEPSYRKPLQDLSINNIIGKTGITQTLLEMNVATSNIANELPTDERPRSQANTASKMTHLDSRSERREGRGDRNPQYLSRTARPTQSSSSPDYVHRDADGLQKVVTYQQHSSRSGTATSRVEVSQDVRPSVTKTPKRRESEARAAENSQKRVKVNDSRREASSSSNVYQDSQSMSRSATVPHSRIRSSTNTPKRDARSSKGKGTHRSHNDRYAFRFQEELHRTA